MTRIHGGLVWLSGDPAHIELLALDPQIATFVIARPQPGLLAFLPAATARIQARLLKLGAAPRRVEAR